MATKTDFGSRGNQISKDVQGSDEPIPLSPQWLLPKPGENKAGISSGENHFSSHLGNSSRPDIMKSLENSEEMHDAQKKKDVFRPSVLDMESGRRDRWRDEERETNSSVRKDRWREGDKEFGDSHKVDRWTDNSSGRHFGEARRVPSERWTDSSNREINYDQSRNSKWNMRWGPDDKEADGMHEKWLDSSKDIDVALDKGSSVLSYHGKDEREGDHYRPWRSNSFISRGKADSSHLQTSMANKQIPTFVHGQGRVENSTPTFSLGRGRVTSGGNLSNYSHSLGSFSEKTESSQREFSSLRYSRTKLLDVYRMTDFRSSGKLLDEIVQVPSLTRDEPLEPLAFCEPSSEEVVLLKGIDKGDILSSGAPQITKDGSVGRSLVDTLPSRRVKIGSKEDLPLLTDSADNSKGGHSSYSEVLYHEKPMSSFGSNAKFEKMEDRHTFSDYRPNSEALREDDASYRKNDQVATKESSMQGSSYVHPGIRSLSISEHTHSASPDWREISTDGRSKTSEIGWLKMQKDSNNESGGRLADQSYSKNGTKWNIGDDSIIRRQLSAVPDRESEARKLSPPSPEDLLLYYKDPRGEIQGPFSGTDIIGWFEAGYFGIDLQVRLANAPLESPFALLGDVMPHLRAKAHPPPGFSAQKQNEMTDAISKLNISSLGKLHAGSSENDMLINEPRYKHGSAEAENRFQESLMSGNLSSTPHENFAPAEGIQGYFGNNTSAVPPLGAETADNLYLLAKRMALERQKSLPRPNPYWPERDASSVPKSEYAQDSPISHSNLQSSIGDNPLQQLQSQSADYMSILQGLSDRSKSNVDVSILQGLSDRSNSGVNNGVGDWSKFPVHGGLDPLQDKLSILQGQNISPQAAFGIQQQGLHTQNQPSFTNLLAQSIDNPSGAFTPEKILSSGVSQDPQLLNFLQQQYLLQLQSPASVPTQQLSVLLDKLVLLKQLQKQEEQQQLLRLQQQQQQQQQQLLYQVLSEHHSHQHYGEASYGQLQAAGFPGGNAPTGHPRFQVSHELLQSGSQIQVPNMQDEHVNKIAKFPPSVFQDVSDSVGPEASSMHLPHEMFGNAMHQNGWGADLPGHIDNIQLKGSLLVSAGTDAISLPEVVDEYQQEHVLQHNVKTDEPGTVTKSETGVNYVPTYYLGQPVNEPSGESKIPVHEQANVVNVPSATLHEDLQQTGKEECVDSFAMKEVKTVEACEVKRVSEKKKKQKSSKAQSTDLAKGPSKIPQSNKSEKEGTNSIDVNVKSGTSTIQGEVRYGASLHEAREGTSDVVAGVTVDRGHVSSVESVDLKSGSGLLAPVSQINAQVHTGQCAWKPAPGLKPKSLLEIQQEEQRKAQAEIAVPEISPSVAPSFSTPWAGVVTSSDPKSFREIQQDGSSTEVLISEPEGSLKQKKKKSQLHDLLAEEVNSTEKAVEVPDSISSLTPIPVKSSQCDSIDEGSFIEAKDTKKNRKKSAKAKTTGDRASVTVASSDVSLASSPSEKGKSSRLVQQKEVLPAVPSGPSLGDFVVWKGEMATSSPAPAWSTDSGKLPKPTSLRDILKEQGKKVSSVQHPSPSPIPQKSFPTQPTRGNGPSWSASGSSPAKAASPIQIISQAPSQSKNKVDDDFFWGPLDQPKQESKQSDFPDLSNQGSWGKNTLAKGTVGVSVSRQKSLGGRPAESAYPASAHPSLKGKNDALTKHSEAMDFRDWCEKQCLRLVGTKDTSFLEFCLKQSRSEAEIILIENLGSFDPDHEFIEKFLNYKDFLPADVLDIAFQGRNDQKVTGFGPGDVNSVIGGTGDNDQGNATGADGPTKGGGKKKGKKGKKVSPAVLGFNVVSNRIMMGEIQAVED